MTPSDIDREQERITLFNWLTMGRQTEPEQERMFWDRFVAEETRADTETMADILVDQGSDQRIEQMNKIVEAAMEMMDRVMELRRDIVRENTRARRVMLQILEPEDFNESTETESTNETYDDVTNIGTMQEQDYNNSNN